MQEVKSHSPNLCMYETSAVVLDYKWMKEVFHDRVLLRQIDRREAPILIKSKREAKLKCWVM